MNAKFFRRLPEALHRHVDTFLNSSDSAHLARTSSDFDSLSKQPPLPMSQRKALNKFLGHVVHGEREPMQDMLRQNNQLLLQRYAVTDYSGRTFNSISGFEYALWALDKHLWDDMLAFLPRDEQGYLTEDGRELAQQLLRQLERIKDQKITYILNGKTIKESHYDFAIVGALQKYVDTLNAPREKNRGALDTQWCKMVGGAQRVAPVHVVDEYCSNTPFYPLPQFDYRPQPAKGLRQYFNWVFPSSWESWFGINSRLGLDFAIYKGTQRCSKWVDGWSQLSTVNQDLEAMETLRDTRTQDFTLLETQLNSLLDVEEQLRPKGGM